VVLQPFMIEPQQMQHRGVQIVHVHRLVDRAPSDIVVRMYASGWKCNILTEPISI
jgi:hypothetical protein